MNFRPYMLFSLYTPYRVDTLASASLRSGKLSPCLVTNLPWESRLSQLTPKMAAPAASNSPRRSRNAHASFVQPEVRSFG